VTQQGDSEEVIRDIEEEFEARAIGLEEQPALYTIARASEVLGMSEQEVTRLVLLKKIPAVRMGRSLRIREEALERFVAEMTSPEQVPATPVLYSAEQVAEILQLSLDNVWRLLKEGHLKGFKIRGGRSSWRIPAEALNEFIRERMQETNSQVQSPN
jgi:excisionase family DNA binding protein